MAGIPRGGPYRFVDAGDFGMKTPALVTDASGTFVSFQSAPNERHGGCNTLKSFWHLAFHSIVQVDPCEPSTDLQ